MTWVKLLREGSSAAERWPSALEWRQWAYEQAVERGLGRLEAPVEVRVAPTCRDRRGVKPAGECDAIAQAVLEGLLAAGVLGDPLDVIELTFVRPLETGRTTLEFTLTDAAEPF